MGSPLRGTLVRCVDVGRIIAMRVRFRERWSPDARHLVSCLLLPSNRLAISMFLFFEFLSYAGLLLTVVGVIWLLTRLVRGKWRSAAIPALLTLVGITVFAFPMVYTRLAVDLGPHEQIVDSERHLTLTGWDRSGYDVLATKTDTVVLQMANADVTDETLRFLLPMSQLRELDINDSQVSDAGLGTIAELKSLRTLKLRATPITDQGFRDTLLHLPNLQQLDVRQTGILPETIAEWKQAQPGRRALQ